MLVECRVCGERKYSEKTGGCLSERCSPSRSPDMPSSVSPVVREPVVQLIAGEDCPTCGQTVTLKAELKQAGRGGEYEKVKKERQRRARKKDR